MNEISTQKIKGESKNNWFSDTMAVAFLTAFSYFIAFLYHFAYLQIFRVPIQFISISLTDIFISVLVVLSMFGFFINIATLFLIFVPLRNKDHPIFIAISNLSSWLLIATIIIFFFYRFLSLKYWLIIFGFLAYTVSTELFPPIFNKQGRTYIENMSKQQKRRPLAKVFDFFIPPETINFRLLIVLVLAVMVAFAGGISKALDQKEFPIFINPTSTTTEMAIVGVFDGNILAVPFDRKTKEFRKEFQIFDPKTLDFSIKIQEVGPLQVKK